MNLLKIPSLDSKFFFVIGFATDEINEIGRDNVMFNATEPFKSFHSADSTLAGIELHHMLCKNQHTQSNDMIIFEQFYGLAA